MAKHYENPISAPMFGQFADPFSSRAHKGNTRPSEELPRDIPAFHREYCTDRLYFSWLGHSSVFLVIHGKTILIDPVFSRYASPLPFAGPKRFAGKAPQKSDFPEIDYVLITHCHYDHLDRKTIRMMDSHVKQYVVPEGVGKILHRFGVAKQKITELTWNQELEQDGLTIVCTASQHTSARSLWDKNQSLWCSYVLSDDTFRVFDTGDGGYGTHFQTIREQYGPVDFAIMECGQYHERWHGMHMFPEESVEAAKTLGAGLAIPVHWGGFVLSDHAWDDPPKRFLMHAEKVGLNCEVPRLYALMEFRKDDFTQ